MHQLLETEVLGEDTILLLNGGESGLQAGDDHGGGVQFLFEDIDLGLLLSACTCAESAVVTRWIEQQGKEGTRTLIELARRGRGVCPAGP